jgi:hypothetical protein
MQKANHIMYLHGLEGSPQGTKGSWMRQFMNAIAPEMPARRTNLEQSFLDSYTVALAAVHKYEPKVIVGSSFGGAILMRLLQSGDWSGNAVMLAPAGIMYGIGETIPKGSTAIIIHSPSDAIVSYSDSQKVIKNSPSRAELWPAPTSDAPEGNHRLSDIIENGQLCRAVTTQLLKITPKLSA